jgi:hypothetical protein
MTSSSGWECGSVRRVLALLPKTLVEIGKQELLKFLTKILHKLLNPVIICFKSLLLLTPAQ